MICSFQLLGLVSTVILESEFHGFTTIFYSLNFETPPTCRARCVVFISPRNRVAPVIPPGNEYYQNLDYLKTECPSFRPTILDPPSNLISLPWNLSLTFPVYFLYYGALSLTRGRICHFSVRKQLGTVSYSSFSASRGPKWSGVSSRASRTSCLLPRERL
jgi:hypothetical protein